MDASFSNSVPVASARPPEELVTKVAGGCGRWQIIIVILAVVAEFIFALDHLVIATTTPQKFSYNCQRLFCLYNNICNSTFVRNCTTEVCNRTRISDKKLLDCTSESYIVLGQTSYELGLVAGYILTGYLSEGPVTRRIVGLLFLGFQSVTGLLLLLMVDYVMLLFFIACHGIASTSVNLMPKIIVCEYVGNNLRTISLAFLVLPFILIVGVFPKLHDVFPDARGVMITNSVLPLFLILLLIVVGIVPSRSPVACFMEGEFGKGEKVLRSIAKYNKKPVPDDVKIVPVEVINPSFKNHELFCIFCTSSITRNIFFALLCLWFFHGLCSLVLMHHFFYNVERMPMGSLAGFIGWIISVSLCHVVKHRLLIAVKSVLKSLLTISVLLFSSYLPKEIDGSFALVTIAVTCYWSSLTVLDNLSPRVFASRSRTVALGSCFAVFALGRCVGVWVMHTSEQSWGIISVIVIGLILEPVSSLWLWDVHGRELPDCHGDAVQFQKFYKPIRFVSLHQDTSSTEIEVASVEPD